MPLWNKLLGRSTDNRTRKDPFPQHFELIPGKLTAEVYLHEIPTEDPAFGGSVPCWSYVTNGLWAHKQKEVIFTLRRAHSESEGAFPRDPLRLFADICSMAQQGRLVDAGGSTRFGGSGFFGRHLAYISPQSLPGVTLPDPAITALLVTQDEVTAAQEFGITRLMARLGQASRYYPCPPWSDRSRPGLSFVRTRQESILARAARMPARGVRVCKEGKQVTVRFAPRAGEQLKEYLPQVAANVGVALLTDLDPTANGCLVWEPGQASPMAITPPNSDASRLSGCFILFIPEATEDGGQLLEDGFALRLTNSSWAALRQALLQGQEMTIPGAGEDYSVSIKWMDEVYYNPVDSTAYVAPGGWETYYPLSRVTDHPSGAARLESTRLLSSDHEIAANISTPEFLGFLKAIQEQVQRTCAQARTAFELFIQCTLHPAGAPTVKMSYQGDADQGLLEALYTALGKVHPLNTKHSSVGFQMHFVISPGSRDTATPSSETAAQPAVATPPVSSTTLEAPAAMVGGQARPEDATAFLDRGSAYLGKGDWDKAIAEFDTVIQFMPEFAEAFSVPAEACAKDEYDRAIADHNEAIQLNPDLAAAYNRRGIAYYGKGDCDRAMADYDKAIQLEPDSAGAYNHRGLAYQAKGDYDRAIADYDKAIQLEPNYAEAYYMRGVTYHFKGNYDRAIADYDKAIQLNPDYALPYYNRGLVYYGKGDYYRAIADYSKAIQLNPDDASAYYKRGVAYYSKGDHSRAIADYDKAIQLNPELAQAYFRRGGAHEFKGDHDRAIPDYDKAIQRNPNYAEAYNNRGSAYGNKGDHDRAMADFDKAIQLMPDYAEAYINRGNAYRFKGDYDRAIADCDRAIQLRPDYAEPYHVRGLALKWQGRKAEAVADLKKSIELTRDPGARKAAEQVLKELRAK